METISAEELRDMHAPRKSRHQRAKVLTRGIGSHTAHVIIEIDGERIAVEVTVTGDAIAAIARKAAANGSGKAVSGGIRARVRPDLKG